MHQHFSRFDPDAHLFGRRGSIVYDRLAPLLVGWLYNRVANDVAAANLTGLVVDLGCGPGHATVRIARGNPAIEMVGIDPSADMIDRARANANSNGLASHLRFEVGSSATLPFADSSVALIVSSLSVHHWEDVAGGLAECMRVLRPGGEFWIYEPDVLMGRHIQREVRRQARALTPEPAFGRNTVRVGPIPLVVRMRLRRPASG
jgi:ubiquinone/menaquinone biosynthesis C-methylase UbiE